MLCLSR